MIKMLSLLAPALMLILSGCSLAPDYQRPEMDIPQTWEESQSQALQTKWWERFHDETLNALVEEALQNNRNIDTSKLTQGQFEALVDVSFNAPGYMKTLSEKTNAALAIRENGGDPNAQKAFDEAAYEFNQQLSNSKIAAGLCKRRIRNVLRYCGVENYHELPADSNAKKRITILALNGYNASSLLKKGIYTDEVCKILGITQEEFNALKYPKGYKS